jgi:hypothetical protein
MRERHLSGQEEKRMGSCDMVMVMVELDIYAYECLGFEACSKHVGV